MGVSALSLSTLFNFLFLFCVYSYKFLPTFKLSSSSLYKVK